MKHMGDPEKKSLKQNRVLRILAIGDSNVGKSTFLKNYCSQQSDLEWKASESANQDKVSKTIGCDIHVCFHNPNTRALISDSVLQSNEV